MKFAWPLAAAAASVFIVVIAWTVMAMGLPSAERLGPSETVDGIEVPVIGTVGDFPEPGRRVVVNVTAEGRTTIEGGAVADYDGLVAVLRQQNGPAGEGTSLSVVLRADQRAAWGIAQGVLTACAESGVGRVFFAVRHEQDKTEGAVFACRPKDLGSPRDEDTGRVVRRVSVWQTVGSGTPEGVYGDLTEFAAKRTDRLVVLLDVDPQVSFGFATRTLDAALRSGAEDVRCTDGDPARHLPDAHAVIQGAYLVRVWTQQPVADVISQLHEIEPGEVHRVMPPVGRVRGRSAGLLESR